MTGPVSSPDLDLDKLRELADAATPGPWRAVRPGIALATGNPTSFVLIHDEGMTDENAQFIAAAREAVPSLMVLVGQLQEQLDAVLKLHHPYGCTEAGNEGHETCGEREWCYTCPEEMDWPCTTYLAITEAAAAVLAGRKENHDG